MIYFKKMFTLCIRNNVRESKHCFLLYKEFIVRKKKSCQAIFIVNLHLSEVKF